MKDILVDQNGNLRCPKCKGTNFDLQRTNKAKVGGFVTIGIGLFVLPKRIKCLTCGTTSKGGDAKKWTDPAIRCTAVHAQSGAECRNTLGHRGKHEGFYAGYDAAQQWTWLPIKW